MKKIVLFSMAAFALLFNLGGHGLALAEDAGPAEMTLTTEKNRKPAVFPHKKHQEVMPCNTCHQAENFPKDAGTENWTMKMGHDFCKDCHQKGYEGKTGPNKCGDCHK